MNLDKFERYPLTFGITPIEHLPRLTEAVGAKVDFYAKRDDCNSGLAMGGNKLRKLEYIVPDAIASGADTLVSIGGVQSNHTRMVAATAAKIGMKCVVIQESWVPHEDAASVHKYGGLGYAGFAEEVRAQEAQMGIKFDYIIVCVVTGSTQAGMIVGFAADDRADRVIGIDGSGTPDQLREQVRGIVDNTATLVELGRSVRDNEIIINPDYAYPAYGVPSHETNEAIRLAARTEAMITDPVYEGKSMQGMIDLAKKGFFAQGSKVLYAHLGGAPALNGYSYTYRNG